MIQMIPMTMIYVCFDGVYTSVGWVFDFVNNLLWVHLFRNLQRIGGYHERTSNEPQVYGKIFDGFYFFENDG